MDSSNISTGLQLVRDGGAVLIAVVVVGVLLYLGWRFIVQPGMKQQTEMAKANEEAARQHAIAAQSNAEAAKANGLTSEANSRTAAHLERLTEMFLNVVVNNKN